MRGCNCSFIIEKGLSIEWVAASAISNLVIATKQLHSTKPELRFYAGSNPARGVSQICDGEDIWQWYRLEIRLSASRWSTIPQK